MKIKLYRAGLSGQLLEPAQPSFGSKLELHGILNCEIILPLLISM
jgi:hypothetical protein